MELLHQKEEEVRECQMQYDEAMITKQVCIKQIRKEILRKEVQKLEFRNDLTI